MHEFLYRGFARLDSGHGRIARFARHMSGLSVKADGLPLQCLRKVLVVDDEPDLVDVAAALLRWYGFEVLVATCGADALHLLASDGSIDAMFSDVTMPGMSGFELADAVARAYPRIRIVLTSGYMAPALAPEGGVCHLFTPKPYRIETVVALLRGEAGR